MTKTVRLMKRRPKHDLDRLKKQRPQFAASLRRIMRVFLEPAPSASSFPHGEIYPENVSGLFQKRLISDKNGWIGGMGCPEIKYFSERQISPCADLAKRYNGKYRTANTMASVRHGFAVPTPMTAKLSGPAERRSSP
jgi:hypothetical protein